MENKIGLKMKLRKEISFRFLLMFVLIIFFFIKCSNKKVEDTQDKFEVKKGINIAHFLSQSKKRGAERNDFFVKEDVEKIAGLGFDHIRLPIDEVQMWDENQKRHAEAFRLMEKTIALAIDNNLKVIVDLHILRSHHFNAATKPLFTDPIEQQKFFNLWKDLSKSLKKYPNNMVAYELMNEAVADDNETWNKLLLKAFKEIRELEKERTIVIGSNRWQSVHTFDELKVPEGDKNILLSFHFYEPFLLTHYAAGWTPLKGYNGTANYPGVILPKEDFNKLPDAVKPELEKWVDEIFNKEIMLAMWKQPIEKAKKLNLPLYCGEFGVISNAPDVQTLTWYKDMMELFEETGIGFAKWNYKSDDFGLYNNDNTPKKELIKIITEK